MIRVLIVDDVSAMVEQYAYDLHRLGGYDTTTALSGEEALDLLEREPVDCVVLDLEMPGWDGFEVLRQMHDRAMTVPVIVYTGTGTYERCVQAVRQGAYSFVDKNEPVERVVREIENAVEHARLVNRVRSLSNALRGDLSLVGSSEPMRKLKAAIARVAPIPSAVLILGESGSGKELVARDLHSLMERHLDKPPGKSPFVAVNCAALPEQLIESELFGHERGAFTGASALRRGAFETAAGGTMFLDEIGELPLPAQAKLLRVLEQREIVRVGGSNTINVTARVVAATHRVLADEVSAGRFREDLLYRLNVHVLAVPPLRDRLSDIPELVRLFVESICARFGMRPKTMDVGAVERLMSYDWGRNNVRELRNVVERMIIAADGDVITETNVPVDLGFRATAVPSTEGLGFAELKAEAERRIVLGALERHAWHVTNAAKALGLADHASLLKIMRRHGIARPESTSHD